MREHHKTPTMADVARHAGVSVASVSNYLNNSAGMSAAIQNKIAKAIAALDYQINSSARNLRSGRTMLLKLAIPDLRQVYFSELAEDVLAEARTFGYGVIVESTSNNRQRELESVMSMGRRAADGLILSPLLMRDDDVMVFQGDYPIVLLGERLNHSGITHVAIRNRPAARAATEHLIAAGAQRIAVIGGVRDTQGQESSRSIRSLGYRDALEHAGIVYDPELIHETKGWDSIDGTRAITEMLDEGLHFDAIFALNDSLAWGAIRRLRERHIKIPEEVRVIGFDNVDESAYMIPSLTTVDPDKQAIARLAVKSIMDQLGQGSRVPAHTLGSPFSLVFRESSPQAV